MEGDSIGNRFLEIGRKLDPLLLACMEEDSIDNRFLEIRRKLDLLHTQAPLGRSPMAIFSFLPARGINLTLDS
jgi:hypothetical protein